jgi:hypothetical protein
MTARNLTSLDEVQRIAGYNPQTVQGDIRTIIFTKGEVEFYANGERFSDEMQKAMEELTLCCFGCEIHFVDDYVSDGYCSEVAVWY